MDSQLPVQPIHQNFLKFVLFIFIFLILGFVLGFAVRPYINLQKTTTSSANRVTIDESKLPISIALLNNPIVYEWRGDVKGKMTKKDEDTFTLVDDQGNSVTITDITPTGEKWKTRFYDKSNKIASYSAIPIGTTLFGSFFIFKTGPNTPVGAMFIQQ